MIWDDLVTPSIDGTAGNKTQVQQWQCCRTSPTGSAGTNFEILRTAAAGSLYPHAPEMAAKLFIKVINPACSSAITEGFKDLNSVTYPAIEGGAFFGDPFDDSGQNVNGTGGVFRLELWPTVATVTPNFVTLLCPRASTATYTLTTTPILNSTQIGATINGIDCFFNRNLPYGATVGVGTPAQPPPAVTGLVGNAGDAVVSIDWNDNTDPALTKYRVYRSVKVAGVYNAFTQLAEISTGVPIDSFYNDLAVTNGTTYRYKVTAFGNGLESADSNIVSELTPTAPVVFEGTIPWKNERYRTRYKDGQQ
jgi:hypothetical protein